MMDISMIRSWLVFSLEPWTFMTFHMLEPGHADSSDVARHVAVVSVKKEM